MRLALALLGAVVLLVLVAGSASGMTDWERCEELPSHLIEECLLDNEAEEAGESHRPPSKPTKPIQRHVRLAFPGSRSLFANCPIENTVGLATGGTGLACELRFVRRGWAVKGSAVVEPEADRLRSTAWSLVYFRARNPQRLAWRRCAFHDRGRGLPRPIRLMTFGTLCPEARYDAGMILYRARAGLPPVFYQGQFGTNTLGFVINRFRCRGKTGRHSETASCATRFGDRLRLVIAGRR